jgi:hypothetical protein
MQFAARPALAKISKEPRERASSMLGSVSHIGIKVDKRPDSQFTVEGMR